MAMMANTNRKDGNHFEKDLCLSLSAHGFWVHNLAQNRQGQPFDVIAVRDGEAYAIDCKVCKNDTFPLGRIEENQRFAMNLWKHTGNGDGWFALRLSDGEVYFFRLIALDILTFRQKQLSCKEIKELGIPLNEWVK